VLENLDHIQELGANAIYFCPIFQSAANHRYHTYDYMNVDPLLGGNQAMRALLDEAHRRGMRVILDGVFNHASRGFFQFHDILENGRHSPYIDWFTVRSLPLNAYDERAAPNYDAWWSLHALPKFNTSNADVREYLMRVGEFWIDFGIDGWRLDVPSEINDDSFWQEFRTRVKAINPDAYLVGEIWHEARQWLQGDQFDAVMNYLFTKLCIEFFIGRNVDPALVEGSSLAPLRHIEAAEFGREIDALLKLYSREITEVQMNLLDSHDTARYLTMARNDQTALRLATLFQMVYPGAPSVYYADEIGIAGGKDPLSRASFPWDRSEWDTDLLDFFKRAIALRHAHPALRRGDYHTLFAQGSVYVMSRNLADDVVVVAFNTGNEPVSGAIPVAPFLQNGMALRDEWTGQTLQVDGGLLSLNMPARSGSVFALVGAMSAGVAG
jgi:glycosidase